MSRCAIYAIVSLFPLLLRWLCAGMWFEDRSHSGKVAAIAFDRVADIRGLGLCVDVRRSESHCDDVGGGCGGAMRGRRRRRSRQKAASGAAMPSLFLLAEIGKALQQPITQT
ncbi:cell division protease ftsh [Alternaria alternata]|nr:cell division protease ftsh [Alternaria alternata]